MLKALGYPVLAVGLIMGLRTFDPSEPPAFVPAPVNAEIAMLPPPVAPPPVVTEQRTAEIVPPRPVPVVGRSAPSTINTSKYPSATVTVTAWRTSVVAFNASPENATAGSTTATTSGADRYHLVRAIQGELRRVGCYQGAIDGSWGMGAKHALAAFIDRVNASLPIAEPDYILLTLLRAQTAAVCSAQCPQGQSGDFSGRCMPNAILAQAMKRNGMIRTATAIAPPEAQVAWTSEVRPSAGTADLPAPAPLPGRMSIGGPRPVALGTTAESDLAVPTRTGATYTTASLTGDEETSQLDGATVLRQEMVPAAVPVAPRAVKASKPARRYERSRSVQQLFTHPLGHM